MIGMTCHNKHTLIGVRQINGEIVAQIIIFMTKNYLINC